MLSGLDIVGQGSPDMSYDNYYPSGAKYGVIMTVNNFVLEQPIVFKVGLASNFRISIIAGNQGYNTEFLIKNDTYYVAEASTYIVWYG